MTSETFDLLDDKYYNASTDTYILPINRLTSNLKSYSIRSFKGELKPSSTPKYDVFLDVVLCGQNLNYARIKMGGYVDAPDSQETLRYSREEKENVIATFKCKSISDAMATFNSFIESTLYTKKPLINDDKNLWFNLYDRNNVIVRPAAVTVPGYEIKFNSYAPVILWYIKSGKRFYTYTATKDLSASYFAYPNISGFNNKEEIVQYLTFNKSLSVIDYVNTSNVRRICLYYYTTKDTTNTYGITFYNNTIVYIDEGSSSTPLPTDQIDGDSDQLATVLASNDDWSKTYAIIRAYVSSVYELYVVEQHTDTRDALIVNHIPIASLFADAVTFHPLSAGPVHDEVNGDYLLIPIIVSYSFDNMSNLKYAIVKFAFDSQTFSVEYVETFPSSAFDYAASNPSVTYLTPQKIQELQHGTQCYGSPLDATISGIRNLLFKGGIYTYYRQGSNNYFFGSSLELYTPLMNGYLTGTETLNSFIVKVWSDDYSKYYYSTITEQHIQEMFNLYIGGFGSQWSFYRYRERSLTGNEHFKLEVNEWGQCVTLTYWKHTPIAYIIRLRNEKGVDVIYGHGIGCTTIYHTFPSIEAATTANVGVVPYVTRGSDASLWWFSKSSFDVGEVPMIPLFVFNNDLTIKASGTLAIGYRIRTEPLVYEVVPRLQFPILQGLQDITDEAVHKTKCDVIVRGQPPQQERETLETPHLGLVISGFGSHDDVVLTLNDPLDVRFKSQSLTACDANLTVRLKSLGLEQSLTHDEIKNKFGKLTVEVDFNW